MGNVACCSWQPKRHQKMTCRSSFLWENVAPGVFQVFDLGACALEFTANIKDHSSLFQTTSISYHYIAVLVVISLSYISLDCRIYSTCTYI